MLTMAIPDSDGNKT